MEIGSRENYAIKISKDLKYKTLSIPWKRNAQTHPKNLAMNGSQQTQKAFQDKESSALQLHGETP